MKAIGWNLADKLINQLGYFACTLYIARLIGPESFGLVGMLAIFILLSEAVLQGFSQALIQRSHDLTEEDSSTIFYTNLVWALLIYSMLYISAPYIADFYGHAELTSISRVLFLGIFINSLMVVFKAKLTIKIDFKSQTIASLIATILSATLAIYLATNGYGYWSLVGLILSKNLTLLFGLFYFSKWLPKLIFSKKSFKDLFKFGSNLMFAGMVATIVNNLSIILIGKYFNAISVGYFTQATNISNYASQFITSTLQGVTYPIMTSIKQDREQLLSLYKKVISMTMLVSLPLLVGLAAISNDVVLLFLGSEWLPVTPLLIALCFARAITPISAINMNILNAIGRSDLFLKVDLVKLPLTLGGLFIAIPFGINALAWMMVFTSILAFFINAYYPYKIFNFGGLQQLKIAKNYIIASAIMYFIVNFIVSEHTLTSILMKIGSGIIIYLSILLLLKDSSFLKLYNEILKFLFTKKHS